MTRPNNEKTTQDRTRIFISKEPIRLGQFLKLANTVQDGFEAKLRIANGEVRVNGDTETRRGKKLVNGDTVTIDNLLLEVTRKQ